MERREKATEGLVQHGVCDSRGRASSRYIGMQAGSSVLRIKFGAKNSRHRTPPKKIDLKLLISIIIYLIAILNYEYQFLHWQKIAFVQIGILYLHFLEISADTMGIPSY